MKDANFVFHGFSTDAAKKSYIINGILNNFIASVEREIEIVTSTPKSEGRMEISFSKHNFHVTVDYDSGYMSHNQESSSDFSLENISEIGPHPTTSRPVYLSEDALLEKPEVNVKSKSVDTKSKDHETITKFSTDFGREDFNESRNLFPSPETVLSTSVISQRTTFSGFDDSDSNTSVEISCSKQIIIENVGSCIEDNELHCNSTEYSLNTSGNNLICQENAQFSHHVQSEVLSNLCISLNKYEDDISFSQCSEENENYLALNNITNIGSVKNSENKKKLTLIFSKNNKENIYSVKRKYQSISPEKNATPEKNDASLDKRLTVEKCPTPKHVTVENETKGSGNFEDILNLNKDFNSEKSYSTPVITEEGIKEANYFDSRETPKKELILRKELDFNEMVLQQENNEYCPVFISEEEKPVFNVPKEKILGKLFSSLKYVINYIKFFFFYFILFKC